MKSLLPASLALALVAPLSAPTPASAAPAPGGTSTTRDSAAEIQALRQEITALHAAYEARLQALEQRLQASTAAPPATPAAVPLAAPPPQAATPAAGANAFNPAISLVLSGLYSASSRDPADYRIAGFALPAGAEAGPGTRGFSLAETELGFAASIDPWWRGAVALALHPDDSVSVEEAYVQSTALGRGLTLKAGRFFSGIGYLNEHHAHTWDFVDNPLAYQALLGTQYADDGLQLRWLAPTEQYLELGLELGRGRGFPGGDPSRNRAGAAALTAHTGGDIGESQNWRAGLSLLQARAEGQVLSSLAADGADLASAFSGSTRTWVADFVWNWAPGGNATRQSLKLQGEYLHSRRSGSLLVDPAGAASAGGFRASQSGWYLQAVYRFAPAWRAGLRIERLDAGTPDYGLNTGLLAGSSHRPGKNALMLDFSPSEFSRWRLQLASDRAREGAADRQLFLQYQMSLGAHGAHGY